MMKEKTEASGKKAETSEKEAEICRKTGRLIGVGVGPGDPELLTLKAIRAIRTADFVAYPTSGRQADGSDPTNLALSIVKQYLGDAQLLEYLMPMSRDREYVERLHEECVADLKQYLNNGKTVAFITLGDPSIYSTYMYLHRKIAECGYETAMIPGIPSFCAAAASLNDSLCEGSEPLFIVPGSYEVTDAVLEYEGNKVFMKTGRAFLSLREKLERGGLSENAKVVEKASLPDEKIYRSLSEAPEKPGYFSLVIVK